MIHRSRPPASAQRIQAQLRAGGATNLKVSTNPVWVVGRAPSGRRIQVLWDSVEDGYYVSHWIPEATEPLGIFPEPRAAVACALHA